MRKPRLTVGGPWTKSSISTGEGCTCVQARRPNQAEVEIGDSKDQAGPTLTTTTSSWSAFVSAVAADRIGRAA